MPRMYRHIVLAALIVFASAGVTNLTSMQAGGKYGKYFFYDVKPIDLPPDVLAKIKEEQQKEQSMVDATHLLNLDASRSKGAPYLDFVWLFRGEAKGYANRSPRAAPAAPSPRSGPAGGKPRCRWRCRPRCKR